MASAMPADPSTVESRVIGVLPAEDARDSAALEWWFLQGWFASPGGRRREFMTSFFRLNLQDHDPGEANGFEMLLALYDPGHSPAHRTQTWISPPVLKQAIEKLHTHNARIDPFVQQRSRSNGTDTDWRSAPTACTWSFATCTARGRSPWWQAPGPASTS